MRARAALIFCLVCITVPALIGADEWQKLKDDLNQPWDKVIVGNNYRSCTYMVIAVHFIAKGNKVAVMTSESEDVPTSKSVKATTTPLVLSRQSVIEIILNLYQGALSSVTDGAWVNSLTEEAWARERARRIQQWEKQERAESNTARMSAEEKEALEKRISRLKELFLNSEIRFTGILDTSGRGMEVHILRGEKDKFYLNDLQVEDYEKSLLWFKSMMAAESANR